MQKLAIKICIIMTIANKLVHRILIRIQEYSMEEENLFYL